MQNAISYRHLCFCLVTAFALLGSIAATTAAELVGTVTKIENQAQIGTRNAVVGVTGVYERPAAHRSERPPRGHFP